MIAIAVAKGVVNMWLVLSLSILDQISYNTKKYLIHHIYINFYRNFVKKPVNHENLNSNRHILSAAV